MDDRLFPAVPKCGQFKIIADNSPFPLEGKSFSYAQIMAALRTRTFRPGMKFVHAQVRRTEFVLTANGLAPFQKKPAKAPAEEVND